MQNAFDEQIVYVGIIAIDVRNKVYAKPKYSLPAVMAVYNCLRNDS